MSLPTSLQVGLKEWHILCSALAGGEQMILLRKGGIYESAGEFEVEHRDFLLFPTYLHQNVEMLKPEFAGRLEFRASEPEQVKLQCAATVTDVIELSSRAQMDALEDEHIWSAPLIDMRFSYKPQNPLYLLVVRAYRLESAVTIANTIAYGGCKSWVPLDGAIATEGALPVMDDATFEKRREVIRRRLEETDK